MNSQLVHTKQTQQGLIVDHTLINAAGNANDFSINYNTKGSYRR